MGGGTTWLKPAAVVVVVVVVVVIAQQLFSYCQLSRLRKSTTAAGLSNRYCKLRRMALTVEQMLYGVWCHSTLRTNV